jgi:hypothetical protein
LHGAAQECAHGLFVRQHTLVDFDSGECQRALIAGDGREHGFQLGFVAHARAASRHAQLDQHLQAPAGFLEKCAELLHAVRRIDEAEKFEVRIGQ